MGGGTSNWIGEATILLFALLVKVAISLHPYSGMEIYRVIQIFIVSVAIYVI
jgi:hypothetical protein